MEDVAFIINPYSAKGSYHDVLDRINHEFKHSSVYISESVEGTADFIRTTFDKVKIYIAIGGDGTISGIASQLVNTDKLLGIYPTGSGNGFSNETGFSKNFDQLLRKIQMRKSRKIDTFTLNGMFSINVSGVGFDGTVAKEFEKTGRGFINYIKVCVKTFLDYKPINIRFSEEKYLHLNGSYLMLNIANTRQFGNHAYIAPHARKSDGFVDLVLVRKFPISYSLGFALRMFGKKLKQDRYITYLPVSDVELEADSTDWHIDGEYRKMASPVRICVFPGSLNILI